MILTGVGASPTSTSDGEARDEALVGKYNSTVISGSTRKHLEQFQQRGLHAPHHWVKTLLET